METVEPQPKIVSATPLNSATSASDIVETSLQDEERRNMELYFQAATVIQESDTVQTSNMKSDNCKKINCGDTATVLKDTLLNNIDIKSPFFGGKYFIKKCKTTLK